MKAGIGIDDWKLPIFKDELTKAGFEFETHPGVTPDTLLLTVMTDSQAALEPTVRKANERARRSKWN